MSTGFKSFSTDMEFCGREFEINVLVDRWKRVDANAVTPNPQIVVIKAEPGLGKTRLVIELYRRLTELAKGSEAGSYWPDASQLLRNDIRVNPEYSGCNVKVAMPYLWWGIKAVDGSDKAITAHEGDLAPHLVSLKIRAKMRQKGWHYLQALGSLVKEKAEEVGVEIVAEAASKLMPYGDVVVNASKLGLKLYRLLKEGGEDQVLDSERKKESQKPLSRAEAILEDLQNAFDPVARDFSGIPGVIFIDDAQFMRSDPALTKFTAELFKKSLIQDWPVLIVVTHWRRELDSKNAAENSSFASILRHARGNSREESLPTELYGILTDAHYIEIDLPKLGGLPTQLKPALIGKLPGLTEDQAKQILQRADGNPRFLEQIVKYAVTHTEFFEGKGAKAIENPLKPSGLEKLMLHSPSIEEVVLARLKEAPIEVREALSFASPQGIRFAYSITDEIAQVIQTGNSCVEGLRKAEDPYSVVTRASNRETNIAEFSERLFYSAVLIIREQLEAVRDGEQIEDTFKEVLRKRLDDEDFDKKYTKQDRIITLSLAADVFTRNESTERLKGIDAYARLLELQCNDHGYETAVVTSVRLCELLKQDNELLAPLTINQVELLTNCLCDDLRFEDAIKIVTTKSEMVRRHAKTSANSKDLAEVLLLKGEIEWRAFSSGIDGYVTWDSGDFEECITIRRNILLSLGTDSEQSFRISAQSDLVSSLYSYGQHLRSVCEPQAMELFEEAVGACRELVVREPKDANRCRLAKILSAMANLFTYHDHWWPNAIEMARELLLEVYEILQPIVETKGDLNSVRLLADCYLGLHTLSFLHGDAFAKSDDSFFSARPDWKSRGRELVELVLLKSADPSDQEWAAEMLISFATVDVIDDPEGLMEGYKLRLEVAFRFNVEDVWRVLCKDIQQKREGCPDEDVLACLEAITKQIPENIKARFLYPN